MKEEVLNNASPLPFFRSSVSSGLQPFLAFCYSILLFWYTVIHLYHTILYPTQLHLTRNPYDAPSRAARR
jgi:hypothetical protein